MNTRFPNLPSAAADLFALAAMVKIKDPDVEKWVEQVEAKTKTFQVEADRVSKGADIDKMFAAAEKAVSDADAEAEAIVESAKQENIDGRAKLKRDTDAFRADRALWQEKQTKQTAALLSKEQKVTARDEAQNIREAVLKPEEDRLESERKRLAKLETELTEKLADFDKAQKLIRGM